MKRLVVLLLALWAAPLAAQDARLRVAVDAAVADVPGVIVAGAAAFPVSVLERFGARLQREPQGTRAVLFGDTLLFQVASPWFRAGAAVHHLAFPVTDAPAGILLPEQFFIEWLPARYPDRLEFRSGALRTKQGVVVAAPEQPAPRAARPASGTTAQSAAATARVVVIDPGHGGVDPGKIGPNGLREKDAALMLGKRLGKLLEERGYEVHLTRTTDTLIALDDRPRLANRWKATRPAALFVSLHLNSVSSARVQGFETFFLSEARTDDERRVAEMENAAVTYEKNVPESGSDVDRIFTDLRNDFYVRASNDLAQTVQDNLAAFHEGPNRGVKRAGFRVLVGAAMPAVLVEAAFISNAEEARMIATSAFQQKVAWGIADAIDRFFAEHEHLWAAGGR
jgi:N-acetylmuramoyl-L-alanine amidase